MATAGDPRHTDVTWRSLGATALRWAWVALRFTGRVIAWSARTLTRLTIRLFTAAVLGQVTPREVRQRQEARREQQRMAEYVAREIHTRQTGRPRWRR